MANFLIRRPSPNEPRSFSIPFACAKGLAMQTNATDITVADKAQSGRYFGFVTQKVTATGPWDQLKIDAWMPGTNLEYDAITDATVTCVDALEYEAEGSDLLMATGVAALDTDTAVGTQISFIDGKACVAQTGQDVLFEVAAQLTPETEGNTRLLFIRI